MINLPKSLKAYADKNLALEYRNRQRRINYYGEGRDQRERSRSPWLPYEDELILQHEYSDRELSNLLKRTIPAIQHRRHRLKKATE